MPALSSIRLLACLFSITLLGSALAAPGPVAAPKPSPFDKYLLDDTDFLAVLNVKDLVRTPLFAKDHKKTVEKALDKAPLGPLFKELGIEPLKDIDRITLAVGRSCYTTTREEPGPVFLVSGRFDLERLRAGLAKLSKPRRNRVSMIEVYHDAVRELYRIDSHAGSHFIVPLDAHTILLARRLEHVTEALAKAAGRKTTRLNVPGTVARLKRLSPDSILEVFALENAVCASELEMINNANGQQEWKRTNRTFADFGLKELDVRVTVKDDVQVRSVLTCANKAKLSEHTQLFQETIDHAKGLLASNPRRQPKLLKFVEGIRVRSADMAVILEARATAEMVQACVELLRAAP